MKSVITTAFELMMELHAGQTRKASPLAPLPVPYTSHLIEVAGMVQANGGTPETVAAALLHDVLEDVSHDAADIILKLCGQEVLHRIWAVTEVGTGSTVKASWKERKDCYLDDISCYGEQDLLLSISNKLHSARELRRLVSIKKDLAYAGFAKKEYVTTQERKQAVLWFHQGLVIAYKERLKVLHDTSATPVLLGIGLLLEEFADMVASLMTHE